MDQIAFGAKIRMYRKEQGLSIQALADKVNITSSMLSQIERDLANPSINTLKLISSALNVSLFQFFTGIDSNENPVVRRDERKTISTKKKEAAYELELLTPDTNGSIEFVIQKFKPGDDSGNAVQAHEGEEVSYLISGQLELTLEGITYQLNAGDSVRIPAMSRHYWRNNGDITAELIFAITPPSF